MTYQLPIYPADRTATNYAAHDRAAAYRPERFTIFGRGASVFAGDTFADALAAGADSWSWGGQNVGILWDGDYFRSCGRACLREELTRGFAADRLSLSRCLTATGSDDRWGDLPTFAVDETDSNESCDGCGAQMGTWFAECVVTGSEITVEPESWTGRDCAEAFTLAATQWWSDNGSYGIGVSADAITEATDAELRADALAEGRSVLEHDAALVLVVAALAGWDATLVVSLAESRDTLRAVCSTVADARARVAGAVPMFDALDYLEPIDCRDFRSYDRARVCRLLGLPMLERESLTA